MVWGWTFFFFAITSTHKVLEYMTNGGLGDAFFSVRGVTILLISLVVWFSRCYNFQEKTRFLAS